VALEAEINKNDFSSEEELYQLHPFFVRGAQLHVQPKVHRSSRELLAAMEWNRPPPTPTYTCYHVDTTSSMATYSHGFAYTP
jgi:hypothetical protein